MKQKWLWVLDPWNTLDHKNDTSLRLIEAAEKQNIKNVICNVSDLSFHSKKGLRILDGFQLKDFQRVFYRVDPPVNLAYLHGLSLFQLELNLNFKKRAAPKFATPIDFVFKNHEKSVAFYLGLSPLTCIASQINEITQFIQTLPNKEAIIKPLNSAQSKGVHKVKLKQNSLLPSDAKTLITLTANETQPIVIQKYLKKIILGETRLWFCQGKLIAAVKKVPHKKQFKIDMDSGSTLKPHQLTSAEKAACLKISKHLKSEKIDLAAIDLIEGLITDYNYTSPGLLVGLEKLLNQDLAAGIVSSLAGVSHRS